MLRPPWLPSQADTDAAGRFSLPHEVPWSECRLEVRAAGCEQQGETRIRLGGPGSVTGVDPTVLRTAALGTIRGRTMLNGQPAPADVGWRAGEEHGWRKAGGGGWFELIVPAGSVEVVAYPFGRPRGEPRVPASDPVAVLVPPGGVAEIELDARLELAAIRGRVLGAEGRGIGGCALLALSSEPAIAASSQTEPDGTYGIDVPAGPWSFTVHLTAQGQRLERTGVRAGQQGVDFDLADTADVILLRTGLGEPAMFLTWTFCPAAGSHDVVRGSFVWQETPPKLRLPIGAGLLILQDRRNVWYFDPLPLAVQPGPAVEVLVTGVPTSSCTFAVSVEPGAPGDWTVLLVPERRDPVHAACEPTHGTAVLRSGSAGEGGRVLRIRPARYRALPEPAGAFEVEPATFEVRGGDGERFELGLAPSR